MARTFLGTAAAKLTDWMTRKDHAPVRVTKSAGFTLDATYLGQLIATSGTWTLGLAAAATLGAGFFFYVDKTDGSGVVTIDPNSTETIEGLSTIALYSGEAKYMVFTDGVAWYTLGRQKGWVDIVKNVSVVAGTANVPFSTPFGDAEIRDVYVDIAGFTPSATGAINLTLTQTTSSTLTGEAIKGNGSTASSAAVTANPIALGVSTIATASQINITCKNINATAASQIRVDTEVTAASNLAQISVALTSTGAMTGLTIAPSAGTISAMIYTVRAYRQ